jgi:uncharacterized protein
MGRPETNVSAKSKSVRLTLHVQPKARENAIIGFDELDRLKVRVTAAPSDGAANKAVIDLLRRTLGVPRSAISIETGQSSRTKIVAIAGLDKPALRRQLAGA